MFNHYFCQKRQEGTGTRLARAGPKHRPYKKRKTAELRRSSEVLRYKDGGRCSTIIFAKSDRRAQGRGLRGRGRSTVLTKSGKPQSFARAAKFCATRAAVDVQPLFLPKGAKAARGESGIILTGRQKNGPG